ncbi:hypothetical protein D6850_02130 [Roseovarius spongiae]|uniref:Uncharacterized protein n=1 Tax=Roseovarius spongiae TaxID=2320272 RepID=A0A3A8AVP5_9RHOB|nr:hypothetical protein [Roseovarius spongiae]RKF16378.1 hypothetical protein D6850_02130 [Roseovarius spongiae]
MRSIEMQSFLGSFLSIGTGIVLFTLAAYGLQGHEFGAHNIVTSLLRPSGYGAGLDTFYLVVLGALGFWLTSGLFVQVASGIALGLVMGKLVLLGEVLSLHSVAALGLALALTAILLRLVAPPETGRPAQHRQSQFWFR